MRKIKLFIASSLDGYIARRDGQVDWLFQDDDYGYNHFYASIDTVVMGRKTYEQILTFGGHGVTYEVPPNAVNSLPYPPTSED